MKNELVKSVARNAIVAAIYVAITGATYPIAFGMLQVRIAEALMLLCFFRRDYIYGLTLGCLIANLFSPMLPWDLIIGTAATFLSCLCICFCKHLAIASLMPVVFNGFMVGAELYFILEEPFWLSVLFVSIGEIIAVCVIGYLLFFLNKKNNVFYKVIRRNRNENFIW
jgi:uncharacterized membrane protein